MSPVNRSTPVGRAYLDLQNQARRMKRGTQELLTMYAVERWLARLSRSQYADDFVLKGGMLLASFGTRRPTIDADALARNMAADEATVSARVAEIAALPDEEDGIEFLVETIATKTIRDDALYSGTRVTMVAQLATAQIKLSLDINFGDPVTPEPLQIELPALRLGKEPIRLLGYPLETVLAEKLSTAMDLGLANTRVRDYVDVYLLTGANAVRCGELRVALEATTAFRNTQLRALTDFMERYAKLRANSYIAYRNSLGEVTSQLPPDFAEVVQAVARFIDPVTGDLNSEAEWSPSERDWIQP